MRKTHTYKKKKRKKNMIAPLPIWDSEALGHWGLKSVNAACAHTSTSTSLDKVCTVADPLSDTGAWDSLHSTMMLLQMPEVNYFICLLPHCVRKTVALRIVENPLNLLFLKPPPTHQHYTTTLCFLFVSTLLWFKSSLGPHSLCNSHITCLLGSDHENQRTGPESS